MRIAIVGAGPAGAWASTLLAKRGHAVTLLDSQAPWEKPCGGGITTKALRNFAIFDSELPRKYIDRITIYFSDRRSVTVPTEQPLAVLSRHDFGKYLLDEAEKAGVSIIKSRVSKVEPATSGFTLYTRDSSLQSDFLIGADGATSMVRRTVGKPLPPEDLCVTLGYFIRAASPPHMKIHFVPNFEGYIWSFPRSNHISYGLITRSIPGWTGRAKMLLSNFILADLGADVLEQAEFYSAPVPCLGPEAWKDNRIAGDRWALLGDAAGLVDPITGEGIYFALKSAEILAQNIETPALYAKKVWTEIGTELERAARMYKRFYNGRFLGGDFKERTVQLSHRSRTVRTILGNLVAGSQNYIGLKRKLFFSIPSIGIDLITGR